jgi:hypothetical protein
LKLTTAAIGAVAAFWIGAGLLKLVAPAAIVVKSWILSATTARILACGELAIGVGSCFPRARKFALFLGAAGLAAICLAAIGGVFEGSRPCGCLGRLVSISRDALTALCGIMLGVHILALGASENVKAL